MENYYEIIANYIQEKDKILVYPTLDGLIEFVENPKDNNTLIVESNYIRSGWITSSSTPLEDEELKNLAKKYSYKFSGPKHCSKEELIKALKKLDTITTCGQLVIKNKYISIIHCWMAIQAHYQSIEWFRTIFNIIPTISLDEIHNLIENNKGDIDSQRIITRSWLQLIKNCDKECYNDNLIIDSIKKQLIKNCDNLIIDSIL